jgi:hypothetical protein
MEPEPEVAGPGPFGLSRAERHGVLAWLRPAAPASAARGLTQARRARWRPWPWECHSKLESGSSCARAAPSPVDVRCLVRLRLYCSTTSTLVVAEWSHEESTRRTRTEEAAALLEKQARAVHPISLWHYVEVGCLVAYVSNVSSGLGVSTAMGDPDNEGGSGFHRQEHGH